MSELRFDERVVIVTGAGGNPGLGRSYALLLAQRGAKVLVNDFGVGPDGRGGAVGGPEAVVKEITDAGGAAKANSDSVATRDGAAQIVCAAMDTWGRIDAVINNAGIAPFALFEEISDADIERIVNVHLMGTIWMCRAVWPHMKSRGYGRIVNVTSVVSLAGGTHQSIYSGAKLGIIGLTRGMALEGPALGIRANAIMPEADTLAWQKMLGAEFSERAREQGKTPETIAPVAAWLAHEACDLNGRVVAASAGRLHEIVIAHTVGTPPDPNLTLEQVGSRFAAAADRNDLAEYGRALPGTGEPPLAFLPKPYTPVL